MWIKLLIRGLKHGRKHKDLMMQNGEYAALYNAQAKYYI